MRIEITDLLEDYALEEEEDVFGGLEGSSRFCLVFAVGLGRRLLLSI
jgi:hypothetical protein